MMACVRYNQKEARKSSKRVQLWIFTPHFSQFRAFRTLHPPKRHVFLDILMRIRHFISQKGHCVRVPHSTSGSKKALTGTFLTFATFFRITLLENYYGGLLLRTTVFWRAEPPPTFKRSIALVPLWSITLKFCSPSHQLLPLWKNISKS